MIGLRTREAASWTLMLYVLRSEDRATGPNDDEASRDRWTSECPRSVRIHIDRGTRHATEGGHARGHWWSEAVEVPIVAQKARRAPFNSSGIILQPMTGLWRTS